MKRTRSLFLLSCERCGAPVARHGASRRVCLKCKRKRQRDWARAKRLTHPEWVIAERERSRISMRQTRARKRG